MRMDERFQVINEMKKFLAYIDLILINFPKKSYVLQDRIETTSYEMLELIYYTNLLDERLEQQKKILAKVSMLDYYLELSYNKKYISLKKMMQGSRILESIRKLIYGWIKSNGC